MRYTTVLFDLDGTLVDTNELIMQSFMYTLEKFYPGKFTREDILPHMGKTLYQQFSFFSPNQAEDMVRTYRAHNEQVHDEWIQAFPHVEEVIEQLAEMGVKMGVVTTKQRTTAEMGLRYFGLDKWIGTLVCYQDTTRHKPEPEPVLLAVKRLQADPGRTIMIGDSEYDILAAKQARVSSAGVAWSIKGAEYLERFSPDYIIGDMRDVTAIVQRRPARMKREVQ
jgi:pyrophosphatase PpaX